MVTDVDFLITDADANILERRVADGRYKADVYNIRQFNVIIVNNTNIANTTIIFIYLLYLFIYFIIFTNWE